MTVLQKQIKIVLDKRPKDFHSLTDFMTDITFNHVLKLWEVSNI